MYCGEQLPCLSGTGSAHSIFNCLGAMYMCAIKDKEIVPAGN
jgi:hypothetical protein